MLARSALLVGAGHSVLAGLVAFAAQRSLGAPDWVAPLVVAWQALWIAAPAVEPLLSRGDPRRGFRLIALAAFPPVLLTSLVAVTPTGRAGEGRGSFVLFLLPLFLYHVCMTAFVPHRMALLSQNVPRPMRGAVFGRLNAFEILGTVLAVKTAGLLLDADPRLLRVVFPAAAAVGFLGMLRLARVRWARGPRTPPGFETMLGAWRASLRLLLRDRGFLLYECAFMVYGMGFLMSQPLLVIYAEGTLRASYDVWTWASGFAFPVAQLLVVPLAGRLVDAIGVMRATSIAFAVLAAFFAAMPFVSGAGALVAAFALFGVAMAGVNVGWSLGPLHFAPEGKARVYGSVHLLLVGVRSALAPFLGYAIREWISLPFAFGTSAALVLLAVPVLLAAERDRYHSAA
jgi:MFS family permease